MPLLLLLLLLFTLVSFITIIVISLPLTSSAVIDVADDTKDGSIPAVIKIPATVSPMPAALATQMPLDHIFSPKIIPANRPIQSKFIHPRANIIRKYNQQHQRQYITR